MPLMPWDKTLDIGVAAMNDEHHDLLDIMNELYDAHTAGKHGASINALVAKLGAACTEHFAHEEAYMQRVGYPGFDGHKMLHVKLLTRYGEFAGQIRSAGGEANDEFFHFLKFWLNSHIKGVDTKYAAHAVGVSR
ncbi:MAG: hemerythrin family protein [Caulobacterales bacterium]|nr:hemerythrin family protein [Caulobacterales bacterium]